MADRELRELERRARLADDPQAQARYSAALCRAGKHDFRCNRICARCRCQWISPVNPSGRLWDALLGAGGLGAVGWKKGYRIGEAHGTFTGLPKEHRKQEELYIQLWNPYIPDTGRTFIPGTARNAFTNEEWHPPYGKVLWRNIGKKVTQRDIYLKSWVTLPKTPKEMIAEVLWEPWCSQCDGNGYIRRQDLATVPRDRARSDVIYPCNSSICVSLPLTDELNKASA